MKFIFLIVFTSLLLFVAAPHPVQAASVASRTVISQAVNGNAQVKLNISSTTVTNTFTNSDCEPKPPKDFKFPSCKSMLSKPGDVAHYTSGLHQIVGGPLLSGSDDVYSLKENNFIQCFCPEEGTNGIQTNWLRTDDPIAGWFFENGTVWNLGNFNYAAKNIDFKCQLTPSPKPVKKVI